MRQAGLALLVFTALSILWTWPLAANLSSRVPQDPGDPILNTWILWWNAQAMPFTEQWWNAPVFVPLPGAIALSEHLLGLSVFATPMQFAGASPILAYNLSLLLSYVLSGLFAYLLALRLTGSVAAAACAGLAFAFAPYRAGHLAHIQVLTSQWMPAMLLGMHCYAASGRARWLVLFGASWLLQALSNGYYMLFLPALIVPWIAWFMPWRTAPKRAVLLVAAWVAFTLPLLPALLKYHAVHAWLGLGRSLGDIRQFSATLESFASTPPLLAFRDWTAALSQEAHLYPGLTVVALAIAGVIAVANHAYSRASSRDANHANSQASSRDANHANSQASSRDANHANSRESSARADLRGYLLFYAAAALLMFALAMGPGGEVNGPPSTLRPYTWLLWLPGYDGLRVPARFVMPGTLCLALAASCSLAWFLRSGGRWRMLVAAAALTGVALDGFTEPVPMAAPPPRLAIESVPDATVIEIPTDVPLVSASAMYRSISHGRPLVNGYSGHTPHHYFVLSHALRRGDTSVLAYMAQERPLVIVVNAAADPDASFRRMIEQLPSVSPLHISGAGPVFLLPRQMRNKANPAGDILEGSVRGIEGNLIQVDLDSMRTVSAVEFTMRGRYADLGERILIEASDDGQQWWQAWLGWTGEFALEAALRDPRLAPVRIPLPSVRARHLRVYPAPAWMREELTVRGR